MLHGGPAIHYDDVEVGGTYFWDNYRAVGAWRRRVLVTAKFPREGGPGRVLVSDQSHTRLLDLGYGDNLLPNEPNSPGVRNRK